MFNRHKYNKQVVTAQDYDSTTFSFFFQLEEDS